MIRVIPDVGAPALVTGVDLLTQEYAPDWNEWASYIMAGAAYVVSGLGIARGNTGEFIKNMGIAALPLAARNILERVRGGTPIPRKVGAGASRLALRKINPASRVAQPVNRAYQPEFEQAGAHAF